MPNTRIDDLLNAYFNRPVKEYAKAVTEIKGSGGLTPEEVSAINNQLRFINACTIVRQAGGRGMQNRARSSEG